MTSLSTSRNVDRRLKELDGWRAFSVLLVIVHHLGTYRFRNFVAPHHHLVPLFEYIGPLGVKVFFVISGFVICRLLILEEKKYGSVSLKGFYVRRAFRILPPLLLYLSTILFLLSIGLILEQWWGVFTSALFLYDLNPARVPGNLGSWFVGHTWSLAVEEQFYVTFPTLWLLTRKIGRGRFFFGAFCLIVAWNLLAALSGSNTFTDQNARSGFACICCGVLLASVEEPARKIARAIPALLMAVVMLSFLWHPAEYFGWKSALFDSLYLPPAIALMLTYFLEGESLWRTLLCSKLIQAVGVTSYGIYLWQELFTAPPRFYFGAGRLIPDLLPLLLLIVPLSYLFVEKPAMRLGRTFSERLRQTRLRRIANRPAYAEELK